MQVSITIAYYLFGVSVHLQPFCIDKDLCLNLLSFIDIMEHQLNCRNFPVTTCLVPFIYVITIFVISILEASPDVK